MNQSYYESVRNQFDRLRKALQEDGQTVNMCECMFLGYALDCIKLADEEFQFELDGSESSLLQFDEILHAAHLAYQTGELKEADLAEFSKLFAGYAGTILIQQLGGVWTYAQDASQHVGPAIDFNGNHLFMVGKMADCIIKDEPCSRFYQWIKENQ